MARIKSLSFDDIRPQHAELFERLQASYGQLPSSFLTLGRMPALLDAVSNMAVAVLSGGLVSADLKWMVAHVASRASGCSYCSAHTGFHAAESAGVPTDKVEALWEFETSDLFSSEERAALRMARAAAVTPNEVTDGMFAELRRFFTDDEIVELVAPVAFYGFLNRWNDTFSSDLEQEPLDFALEHLAGDGWTAKKPATPVPPSTGDGR